MVVVSYDYVAPLNQILAEVVGANTMLLGEGAERFLVQHIRTGNGKCGAAGLRQSIVKTTGERAGCAITSLVRMLAGFFPCDQFQRPKAACVPVAL